MSDASITSISESYVKELSTWGDWDDPNYVVASETENEEFVSTPKTLNEEPIYTDDDDVRFCYFCNYE